MLLLEPRTNRDRRGELRTTVTAVIALSIALYGTSVALADSTTAKKPASSKPISNDGPKQVQFLDDLRTRLNTCRLSYETEMRELQSVYESLVSTKRLQLAERGLPFTNVDAMEVRKTVLDGKRGVGFRYQKCVNDGKDHVSNTGRAFLNSFKGDATQTRARDALAQWLTTIDAVGEPHFAQELSKFDTQANTLKLEVNRK
jgi:hypothetical protein